MFESTNASKHVWRTFTDNFNFGFSKLKCLLENILKDVSNYILYRYLSRSWNKAVLVNTSNFVFQTANAFYLKLLLKKVLKEECHVTSVSKKALMHDVSKSVFWFKDSFLKDFFKTLKRSK